MTPHGVVRSLGEDVPHDGTFAIDQEASHDYDGPDGAFQAIEDLTQLTQAHVRATSSKEKSPYGEFRNHKSSSFDGSTELWVAKSWTNQIARVFTVMRCLPEDQVDLAYMLIDKLTSGDKSLILY